PAPLASDHINELALGEIGERPCVRIVAVLVGRLAQRGRGRSTDAPDPGELLDLLVLPCFIFLSRHEGAARDTLDGADAVARAHDVSHAIRLDLERVPR